MQKTIGDMASYMKQLLPVDIDENYEIDTRFTGITDEENIRKGVIAFRAFINELYDCLLENLSICEIPRKGKEKFSDETTLTVEFPFLNNIKSILINIGHHGVLSEESDSLIINSWDNLSLKRSLNKNSTTKISVPQMMKSLRFLDQCGISFTGIDLSEKKPDVSMIETIKVSYPDNPNMLIGLKVLGLAQNELATRKNDDILLRCDYRMLGNRNNDISSILKGFLNPLSDPIQNFVRLSHEHYLDLGMECNVELGFFCTQFVYSYKKKPLWRFSQSFHNGYRIILKTKNTAKYAEVIAEFPDQLRKRITKGYGCDRKKGTGHGNCNRGCEGFSFPLDESIFNISNELKIWQDNELSSM